MFGLSHTTTRAGMNPLDDEFDRQQLIERVELDAEDDTILFNDIPQRFDYLLLSVNAARSGTDSASGVAAYYNGDTDGENYERYSIRFDGSSVDPSTGDGATIGIVASEDRITSPFVTQIHGYSSDRFPTNAVTFMTQPWVPDTRIYAMEWNTGGNSENLTQPVTDIRLEAEGFIAGSTFQLTGVNTR